MIAPNARHILFCSTHVLSVHSAKRLDDDSSVSDASASTLSSRTTMVRGRWHFVLEEIEGEEKLEVADTEQQISPDRLALLCLVRGLEALEQPSRVTLFTTSRYVNRGLRFGLNSWRENDYRWERFGVQKPIRNADLWMRVDHALEFHGVDCRFLAGQQTVATVSAFGPSNQQKTAEIIDAEHYPELDGFSGNCTSSVQATGASTAAFAAHNDRATRVRSGLQAAASQMQRWLGGRRPNPAFAS